MMEPSDTKELTFIWKIENFSMIPHQVGESLVSPRFLIDMWKGIEWHLKLYPRGKNKKDYMSLYLLHTSTEVWNFEINWSVTLETSDPTKDETLITVFQHRYPSWGWTNFARCTEIYRNNYLYLPQDTLSVRCHLTPINLNNMELIGNENECDTNLLKEFYTSRTGIQVVQKSITCCIQNAKTRKEPIEFSFNEMMRDFPGMKVILNFKKIVNSSYLPIEIHQLDEKQERPFVKCRITVVGTNKDCPDTKEDTYLFKTKLNDVWHFPNFLFTSNLTSGVYLNENNVLVLQCDFAFSHKSGVHHLNVSDVPSDISLIKEDETSEWCTSVKNLCASGKFSDVELKAGDVIFPAYKLLLSSRSSVFSAMFENDIAAKYSGRVNIDDVDPTTLKKMLAFINFDEIKEKDISPKEMRKLYEAADKYNIVSLKKWCRVSLISSICVESVYDIADFADAHQDDFLMTGVFDFMCCHVLETCYSPNWKEFQKRNYKLSMTLITKVLESQK